MIRVLQGDCRDVLATLEAGSVHCVVCSPPYYGLRDYGTAQWDGGDAGCDHLRSKLVSQSSTLRLDGREHLGPYDGEKAVTAGMPFADICGKCGARRIDRQLGLEATPDEYLATMVQVFREVKRVLRDDGTCWVNLGDSFSGGNQVGWRPGNPDKNGGNSNCDGVGYVPGLAAKQLLMMPARLALALQADGWWLRSDIIWHKPNPMPESVTDRPTSAHEHVFLLAKSARYFFDADAVREPITDASAERYAAGYNASWQRAQQASVSDTRNAGFAGKPDAERGRNLRNVWTIATAPFPAAHFATYPPELAERCIRAGTSERGCCAACGAPWVRQTEREIVPLQATNNERSCDQNNRGAMPRSNVHAKTTGWSASCQCDAPTAPCTVLDPFAGAGTSLLVADRLQRDGIAIELSPAYCAMLRNRIVADAPLFAEVAD